MIAAVLSSWYAILPFLYFRKIFVDLCHGEPVYISQYRASIYPKRASLFHIRLHAQL